MAVTVGPPMPAPAPSARHRAAAQPREFRRARTLAGALGVTVLGAVLPGAGYLWSRRRLGYAVLLPFLVGPRPARPTTSATWRRAADLAFDPARLQVAAVRASACSSWSGLFVVATTYLMVAPARDAAAREGARRPRGRAAVRPRRHPRRAERADRAQPGRPRQHRLRRRGHRDRARRRHRGGPVGRPASRSTCCCSAATGESAAPASAPTR